MVPNLAAFLAETAARHGDRPAVKLDDVVLTYRQLDDASARVAGLLQERGLRPGDRVAVMLPNVPYFPVTYYGILRAGGVVVPMNVLLKDREVSYYLEDSGARLLFAWHGFADDAEKGAANAGAEALLVTPGDFEQRLAAAQPAPGYVEAGADTTAVLLYTSGTTGRPKGAELSHANLAWNAQVFVDTLAHATPEDVVLGALPLFHSFGQTCGMNSAVRSGACLTMLPRFDPVQALEVLQRDRVTIFEGVPTMYIAMLNTPGRESYDVSALRLCVSGGAPLPVEVLRGFDEAFGAKILEGYGLSETSPVAAFNHPDRVRKPGSIGTPIQGVEMQVVDLEDNPLPAGEPGEIVIRGHNVMKGYWQRPEATEEALRGGWFHSGDIATVDEDGYYFIVDRKKDLILRGGYNVYPREVEEALYEHPGVAETAVIGVPHPEYGEEVGAAVVRKPGVEVTEDDLREHVKARVAAYKYPRHVWFVEGLPKTATGKIMRREVRPPDPAAS